MVAKPHVSSTLPVSFTQVVLLTISSVVHLEMSIFQTIWKRIWVLSLFRQGTKSWKLSHHSTSENTTFPHKVLLTYVWNNKKNSVSRRREKYYLNTNLPLIHPMMVYFLLCALTAQFQKHPNCVWIKIIFLYLKLRWRRMTLLVHWTSCFGSFSAIPTINDLLSS